MTEIRPTTEKPDTQDVYPEVLSTIRFFLDYRLKLAGFVATVNGAVLAILFRDRHPNSHEGLLLEFFALLLTVACYAVERRAAGLQDQARRLGAEMDPRFLMKLDQYARARRVGRFRFRTAFRLLYGLVAVSWVIALAWELSVWASLVQGDLATEVQKARGGQMSDVSMWADVSQTALVGLTVVLLSWYARETARIRKAEQLANRPFLGLQHEVRHEEVQEIALVVRERSIVLLRNFGRGLATNVEVRILDLGGPGRTAIRTRTAISPMPHGVTTLITDCSLDDIHGCTARITCSDQGGERLTFWQRGDRTSHGGFEHIPPPGREVQEAKKQ